MAVARNVVVLVVALALVAAPHAEAMTCGQIFSSLRPCISYLRVGGRCPPDCCSGVRGVALGTRTRQDRQALCRCLKTAGAGVSGLNLGRAVGLPALCGVTMPYKIGPSTDCSTVG